MDIFEDTMKITKDSIKEVENAIEIVDSIEKDI